MSEQQHKWSGESIAGRYVLGKYLGGTDHSAVFATEIVHARAQRVAIKLIPASGIDIDRQFALWKLLAAISHTNLLKILDYGKCDLDNASCLFVVMEFADEDLADILPQRALDPDEARVMIEPVLGTLAFLHEQRLVHTRVHPGNILATGDQIKLSSDSIVPEGETIGIVAPVEGFSPPEWNKCVATTAEDVWSLGATIIAALTRKAPSFGENGDATVPAELPEPFASICRDSLKQDSAQRIALNGIRAKLNPASVPAPSPVVSEAPKAQIKEVPKIDPVAVPLSKLAPPAATERRPSVPVKLFEGKDASKKSYWLPLLGIVVVAILLFSVPKLFRHQPEAAPLDRATRPAATEKTATPADAGSKSSMTMPKKKPAPPSALTEASQPAAAAPTPPAQGSKSTTGVASRGEVLDEVLPDVSEKARGTIRGTVRVSVRVRVNPTGTVDNAELDSPAASQYFSELAINAAKRWQFSAPEVNGHSAASEWLLHFEFTSSATTVQPTQVSP